MSINLIVNGVGYNYPVAGDQNWAEATTNWAGAVTQNLSTLNTSVGLITTGIFQFANGSAAAPSLRFLNSPTTGLFRPISNTLGFTTSGTSAGQISSTGAWTLGNVTIDNQHSVFGKLLIQSSSLGLTVGADTNALTLTDGIVKIGTLNAPHFNNNSQAPVSFATLQTSSSANTLSIGGGSSILNAATSINFYTATDNITLSGTQIGSASSTGKWILGAVSGTQVHDINGNLLISLPQVSNATIYQMGVYDSSRSFYIDNVSSNRNLGNFGDLTSGAASSVTIQGGNRGLLTFVGNRTASITSLGQLNFVYAQRALGDDAVAQISSIHTTTDNTSGGIITMSTRPTSGSLTQCFLLDSVGAITLGASSSTPTHSINTAIATSATLGSNGATPAQVSGYISININGSIKKIAYYNN